MKLDDKIKELEKKLAIKQAYLNASISFPKGKNIPADVKKIVTDKIRAACAALAEEQEIEGSSSNLFTPEEVQALKSIAKVYTDKATVNHAPQKHEPTSEEDLSNGKAVSQKATKMDRAKLLLLDGVDPTMRKKIEPQAEVVIIETKEDKAFVQDRRANRFWVPVEDLEPLN